VDVLSVSLFASFLSNCYSKHTRTTVLRPSWTLSGTTWVSHHQKGKPGR